MGVVFWLHARFADLKVITNLSRPGSIGGGMCISTNALSAEVGLDIKSTPRVDIRAT